MHRCGRSWKSDFRKRPIMRGGGIVENLSCKRISGLEPVLSSVTRRGLCFEGGCGGLSIEDFGTSDDDVARDNVATSGVSS